MSPLSNCCDNDKSQHNSDFGRLLTTNDGYDHPLLLLLIEKSQTLFRTVSKNEFHTSSKQRLLKWGQFEGKKPTLGS